jgi:hypothetical protein
MHTKSCACCGLSFIPIPQRPDQAYCSKSACQKARRQRWYQEKLQEDPDYRENKRRSQREWMDRNPTYWRQYRHSHPEYTERNRRQQSGKSKAVPVADLAKIDESTLPKGITAGIYRISPVQGSCSKKSDVWIVEISPVSLEPICLKGNCKGASCKDST